jgi:hypothetical protein
VQTNTKISLVILAMVVTMFVACERTDDNTAEPIDLDRPMPCDADEVYVWDDYPNTADCVANNDHGAHADQALPDPPRHLPPTTTETTLSAYGAVNKCEQYVREHGGVAPVEGYGISCTLDEDGNLVAVPNP